MIVAGPRASDGGLIMDDTRSTQQGNVYPTPEGGPITPPTMRDHYDPTAGGAQSDVSGQTISTPEATVTQTSAIGGGGSQSDGAKSEKSPEEAAHELGDRLKPVFAAAEDVAIKALDLSAKGLSKLGDMLEERRRGRDSSSSEPS
jgi:hypothetical protein